MTTTKIIVDGMTCGNCVKHVTEAISSVDNVKNVDIVLEGGEVTIESDGDLDREKVSAAVEDAGYTVHA